MSESKPAEWVEDFDYDDALSEFKEHGFDGRVLLGLSKIATKMVAAWPDVRRWRVNDPVGDKRLHITWHYIMWDMTEWAILANIPDRIAWETFPRLAKMGIIYPDGTYPEEVRGYIKSEVDDLLGTGGDE